MSGALDPHYGALMQIYSDPDMVTETSPLIVADVMQHAVARIEALEQGRDALRAKLDSLTILVDDLMADINQEIAKG